jgi:hypothetical protein
MSATQPSVQEAAALGGGTEHGPLADPGGAQPSRDRLDRAGRHAAGDRDHLALALLVRLAAPDRDAEAVIRLLEFLYIEGDKLEAPERAARSSGARSRSPRRVSGSADSLFFA